MTYLNTVLAAYKRADITLRLVYANAAVFALITLFQVISLLVVSGDGGGDLMNWVGVPASIEKLIFVPWTIITYMFVHVGIWHFAFNMLWFYWFSQIFSGFYNARQQVALYFIGGISGALIYLLFYNIFPYFIKDIDSSLLIGASASVVAIVVATAVTTPNYTVRLMFIGAVKLKYIAIASIFLDIYSIQSTNAGGHIAHLGGALAGYFFVVGIRGGRDLTLGMQAVLGWFVNLFSGQSHKPNMKVKYRRPKTTDSNGRPLSDQEFRNRRVANSIEVDRILDKIKKGGYDSLSKDEKRTLFEAGKN